MEPTSSPLLPGSQNSYQAALRPFFVFMSFKCRLSGMPPLSLHSIRRWRALLCTRRHPGQQFWHLCSCLILITGLRPLGSCPCLGPSFVPRAEPPAPSLIFSLATVILCSHPLHDFLLPVIQAPTCLPRQPPASSPPVVFPSLCEGRVDALSRHYMLLSPKLLHAPQQHRHWVLVNRPGRREKRQFWSLFPEREILGGRAHVQELLGAQCQRKNTGGDC